MVTRRKFMEKAGAAGSLLAAWPLLSMADGTPQPNAAELEAMNEDDFWAHIRAQFTPGPTVMNLNNGGVSPQPAAVREVVSRYTATANEAPSYYLWRVFEKSREQWRARLAAFAGAGADEIALVRNTTEALDIAIFGLSLQRGDEVVCSNFIYPNMNQAWLQRERRDGVVRRVAKLDLPSTNREALVKAYTDQFTPRTKAVLIEHVINWTGQIMPVAEIAAAARSRGIAVLVDGAHSFAHLEFKISDLGCDYFGTSLHKWLCAPIGTGLLYVRRERIAEHWPLFPPADDHRGDITKFETMGTRPVPLEMAINAALDFHESIGSSRKRDRLYFLKQYWTEKLDASSGWRFHTPTEKEWSLALATISRDGKTGADIHDHLWADARIHCTPIVHEGIDGVRITPHLYTQLGELDRLVESLNRLV